MTALHPKVKSFRRAVDAAAGTYYRQDKGLLTGRNSASTDATLRANVRHARELIKAELYADEAPVCDYLDSNPRYAAKWDRVERRFVGLPS